MGTSFFPLPSQDRLSEKLKIEKVELKKKLNLPPTQLWKQIYPVNLLASLLLLGIGIGTAGFYSSVFLLKMGFSLGLRIGVFIAANAGVSLSFWSVVPHGIFELPAFCFLAAVGFRAGKAFLCYLNEGQGPSRQDFQECVTLSIWGLLLISISGVVEAWCTPFFALKYLE